VSSPNGEPVRKYCCLCGGRKYREHFIRNDIIDCFRISE
jgi:hypothetical protein